jgi:hypothetical protein
MDKPYNDYIYRIKNLIETDEVRWKRFRERYNLPEDRKEFQKMLARRE